MKHRTGNIYPPTGHSDYPYHSKSTYFLSVVYPSYTIVQKDEKQSQMREVTITGFRPGTSLELLSSSLSIFGSVVAIGWNRRDPGSSVIAQFLTEQGFQSSVSAGRIFIDGQKVQIKPKKPYSLQPLQFVSPQRIRQTKDDKYRVYFMGFPEDSNSLEILECFSSRFKGIKKSYILSKVSPSSSRVFGYIILKNSRQMESVLI